jgi:hypothetical protein
MQIELTKNGPLLTPEGQLAQVGWARLPLLECNLEAAHFYAIKPLQRFRIKRWDYYAVFTSTGFFSATIADLGYAGNIFVYVMDFKTGDLHEEGLIVPFGKGVQLPRNSTEGVSHFENKKTRLNFSLGNAETGQRHIDVVWPDFHSGRGIRADISLSLPKEAESMVVVIPIGEKRFYYNRKINCMPAEGTIKYGDTLLQFDKKNGIGSLDWGRGVWEYRSYWNWGSSSGFLKDGRTIGLNLGGGFGDLSTAGENALILDNKIHKLDQVRFDYSSEDYMKPWKFTDSENRLNLTFTPFKERVARTNLGIIFSEVHQLFGHYNGRAISDSDEIIGINDLVGFAEEHHARW